MTRHERLRGKGTFQAIYRSGRSLANDQIVLYILARDGGPTRMAPVAGRRLGKAHDRNRAKRLIRAAWADIEHRVSPGWDVLIMARKGMLGLGKDAVVRALEPLMARSGLMDGGERR